MVRLKSLDYSELQFSEYSSQQFATVIFDRKEDAENCHITVIKNSKIHQFDGHNKYNPSSRRHSSCVYVREESDSDRIVKICTIQHKGVTLLEIHDVSCEEVSYIFGNK